MNWYKIGTSEAEQLWWEGGWMCWVWNIQLWGAGKGCSAVEWLRVEHIGGSRLSLVCTWDCTWNVQRVRRDRPSIGEHHGGSGKEERPLRNSEVEGEARVSGVMETQEWCFFRDFTLRWRPGVSDMFETGFLVNLASASPVPVDLRYQCSSGDV